MDFTRLLFKSSAQDLTEFRSGITFLNLKLTPAEAFDEFNFMARHSKASEVVSQDANGGGMVLFDEFCKWAAAKKLPLAILYTRHMHYGI